MNAEVITLLKNAKKLIETVGWTQGTYKRMVHGECKGYCSLGAVMEAAGPMKHGRVADDAYLCLTQALPEDAVNIASFNDNDMRTVEEILGLFDKAVVNAEARI